MNPSSSDVSNDKTKKRKINDDCNSSLMGAEPQSKECNGKLNNQIWEYTACMPSLHDSDEDCNSNNYYHPIESVMNSIKEATAYMRRGTDRGEDNGCIVISYDDDPLDHIYHDDMLMPHWKEFVNALQQYHHQLDLVDCHAVLFAVLNIELTKPVLGILAKALKPNHFQYFKFVNNNTGRDGIAFLAEIISNNPHLISLEFHSKDLGKNIPHYDDVLKLFNTSNDVAQIRTAISNHSSLRQLDFEGCAEGVLGFELMQTLITGCDAKLLNLNLNNCGILTLGSSFLSDFIATNPCLEWLSLDANEFDETDAISIATALKSNKNLKYLSLTKNHITDVGGEALRKAVFDYSSLNTAAASNHTCQIVLDIVCDDWEDWGAEWGDTIILNYHDDGGGHEGPKCRRGAKIFSAFLYEECSIVQYLDDKFLPEILFPYVLGSFQIYFQHFRVDPSSGCIGDIEPPSYNITPLSIVYKLMRGWRMPLLYEYLKKPSIDVATKHVSTVNNIE